MPTEHRDQQCPENSQLYLKELFGSMQREEFRTILESIILGSRIIFKCSDRNYLELVVKCFSKLSPIKEDIVFYRIEDTWISHINYDPRADNKITVAIMMDAPKPQISLVPPCSAKPAKLKKHFSFLQKIIDLIGEHFNSLVRICVCA